MTKRTYVIITAVMAVFLSITALYGFVTEQRVREEEIGTDTLVFLLEHGNERERIEPWEKEKGKYIVFLPSYADMSGLSLSPEVRGTVVVDAHLVHRNESFDYLDLNKEYDLFLRSNDKTGSIEFRKSDNVASMFVSCKQEDYFADKDKERQEDISFTLYDADGIRMGHDFSGKIKGRGNSTWIADKKPYQITLDKAAEVFGMGSAKKWLLLANAYDATNLKNKVVLDLAGKLFEEWSAGGEFVEVYFNGAYNGLYLLTEKIEVAENRVPSDTSCLITQETIHRKREQEYITDAGVPMEIEYPEGLSGPEIFDIGILLQGMEDAILKDSEDYYSCVDQDSWVLRFLVDDFSGNYDADKISSYLYGRPGNNGIVFYGGPVWDYDKAFMQEPDGGTYLFSVTAEYRRRDVYTPYYKALLSKESFQDRVKELYRSSVRSKLLHFGGRGFEKRAEAIMAASENNYIRWQPFVPPVGYTPGSLEEALDGMRRYIDDSIAHMDDKWLDGRDYYIVGIEPSVGGKIREYEVLKGEEFNRFPDKEYYNISNPVWYDIKTGEKYSESFVPTKDIYLYLEEQGNEEGTEDTEENNDVSGRF